MFVIYKQKTHWIEIELNNYLLQSMLQIIWFTHISFLCCNLLLFVDISEQKDYNSLTTDQAVQWKYNW